MTNDPNKFDEWAGANEENVLWTKTQNILLYDVGFPPLVGFHKQGQLVGELRIINGKLMFTGNADESAKILFDQLIGMWDAEMARRAKPEEQVT